MARQNHIEMMGVVSSIPLGAQNEGTGRWEYRFTIVTVRDPSRRIQDNNDVNAQSVSIVVYEPKMFHMMRTLRFGDMIHLKGVVCSTMQPMFLPCDNDRCVNAKTGRRTQIRKDILDVFVVPINLALRHHISFESYREGISTAMNELYQNAGFSNLIITGNVVSNPKIFQVRSGTIELQYQLRISRAYHIRQQNSEIKEDWPWVKEYGTQAESTYERIKKGSLVQINGYLHSARRPLKCQCPQCGADKLIVRSMLEIVPYSTEWLYGTYSEYEVEENKEELERQRFRSAMGQALSNNYALYEDDEEEAEVQSPIDYTYESDAESFRDNDEADEIEESAMANDEWDEADEPESNTPPKPKALTWKDLLGAEFNKK